MEKSHTLPWMGRFHWIPLPHRIPVWNNTCSVFHWVCEDTRGLYYNPSPISPTSPLVLHQAKSLLVCPLFQKKKHLYVRLFSLIKNIKFHHCYSFHWCCTRQLKEKVCSAELVQRDGNLETNITLTRLACREPPFKRQAYVQQY